MALDVIKDGKVDMKDLNIVSKGWQQNVIWPPVDGQKKIHAAPFTNVCTFAHFI